MKTLKIQALTSEYGCCVYDAITVSEDYTMNEVVKAVRAKNYKAFRLLDSMKRFAEV